MGLLATNSTQCTKEQEVPCEVKTEDSKLFYSVILDFTSGHFKQHKDINNQYFIVDIINGLKTGPSLR